MTATEILSLIKKLEENKKDIEKEILELRNMYYKAHREEENRKKEEEANRPPPNIDFLEDGNWKI